MKKKIAILGSTGSIGKQALEVIEGHPDKFQIEVLVANNNEKLLAEQAIKFDANHVVIANEDKYLSLQNQLSSYPVKVFAGEDAVCQVAEMDSVDVVLTAMVGFAGLKPTIHALKKNKRLALANKETLVVAGELISKLLAQHKVEIIPVDSEHSAIFQCIVGEYHNAIDKIYLTASGGPFLNKSVEFLQKVTKHEALKHPNWNMGNKVTIDSASLMNKGLEVIEAKWLFDIEPSQINVVIHPQSIVHSIVQFEDGSMKAQMGLPDMRLPIQYALGFPERLKAPFPKFNFLDYPQLTFEKPDNKKFRNLSIAFEAMRQGGNIPCVMNAANEVVVDAFLKDRIDFLHMPDVIEQTINKVNYIKHPDFEEYKSSDFEARRIAQENPLVK